MATIPMEMLHSCILPRLPVKALARFKSVSKTWQTIISSPEFIHLHHQHALSLDTNRLFVFVDKGLQQRFHVYELDSPLAPIVHWYNPEPEPIMSIRACCEFFILIEFTFGLGLVLLNPSTGKYYTIPYPPYRDSSYGCYGTYLDDANNDYKVARITRKRSFQGSDIIETNIKVMVYSLRTNTWKLFERRLDKYSNIWNNESAAVIRHLLHLIFVPSYKEGTEIIKIGCFDILAEKWITDIPFPHITDPDVMNLSVLDGLLCVTAEDKQENGSKNWSVWVMKEYGVEDSWFKLMSIASNDILYLDFYPIACRKGSRDEVLCRRFCNTLYVWYNIREKKTTTASIEGIYGYICRGSLVDFPGGRHMKLHQPKQAEETTKSSENYLSVDRCTLNQFFF